MSLTELVEQNQLAITITEAALSQGYRRLITPIGRRDYGIFLRGRLLGLYRELYIFPDENDPAKICLRLNTGLPTLLFLMFPKKRFGELVGYIESETGRLLDENALKILRKLKLGYKRDYFESFERGKKFKEDTEAMLSQLPPH